MPPCASGPKSASTICAVADSEVRASSVRNHGYLVGLAQRDSVVVGFARPPCVPWSPDAWGSCRSKSTTRLSAWAPIGVAAILAVRASASRGYFVPLNDVIIAAGVLRISTVVEHLDGQFLLQSKQLYTDHSIWCNCRCGWRCLEVEVGIHPVVECERQREQRQACCYDEPAQQSHHSFLMPAT
jgi:hypothetical protein